MDDASPLDNPQPSTSTSAASVSTTKASKRSSQKSTGKNTGSKAVALTEPGTSQQIKIMQIFPTEDSGTTDDTLSVKQMTGLLVPKAKAVRSAARRGRNSSSSLSSVTPSSSPSSSSLATTLAPTLEPTLLSPGSRRITFSSLSPSTSTRATLPLLEPSFLSSDSRRTLVDSSLLPSTSTATSSKDPTYGLIVKFVVPVSIPIQQGLVRVLDPYRNKIETTPICGNHIFIKLKDKKDIYFLKRQIEILTRLSPRIVVTSFWRYQITVIKPLSPTIKEFVNLNVATLKGEFYVYSRAISEDCDKIIIFEVLADAECRRSIENASCLLQCMQYVE